MRRPSLRTRITVGVLGYGLALALATLLQGYFFNESAEAALWQSFLDFELDRMLEQPDAPASFSASDDAIALYRHDASSANGAAIPAQLRGMAPGVHDEVPIGEKEAVVYVDDRNGERLYLVLDITAIEAQERSTARLLLLSAVLTGGLIVILTWLISGRLLSPLTRLADAFRALRPDDLKQRVTVAQDASREEADIAGAMNEYLDRHARYVARERAFVDTVSHELRTPVAVIAGAADVLASHPDKPASMDGALRRIRSTTSGVEQLINMLLLLAKEPERLPATSERIELADLVPEIVHDHRHLLEGKSLQLRVDDLPPSLVEAPIQVLQVAIGNLLRNAIENSDNGVIHIGLSPAGVVRIADPGHGMTAQEIGRLYAAFARSNAARFGSGIGLELIRRLCEHLGWTMDVRHATGEGTVATLDVRAALVPARRQATA